MNREKPHSKKQIVKKPLSLKNLLNSSPEESKKEGQVNQSSSISEADLHQWFADSSDVHFQTMEFGQQNQHVVFINCEGMIDKELLHQSVYPKLDKLFQNNDGTAATKELILHSLHLPELAEMTNKDQVIEAVFSGKLLMFFASNQLLVSADIAKRPQRTPEETKTEVTVKGPRDNFIEDLAINIALIRKRLRTTSLKVEKFDVGKRSRTSVALLFIDDIASKHIVDQLRHSLKTIDIDAVYSGNQLMELFEKKPLLLPRHSYTGRPDFAVKSLVSGRCIILIDGIAYCNIVPTSLFFLLKSAGDIEYSSIYASFERFMRIVGIFFAAYLPAFWVAITTFHQNQLPLSMLAPVVESRRGLPLPTGLEAIVILMMFELFKEAGLRMPEAIGSTLSVVGALIIGQAAIDARLTSSAMLVVIAISTISTYTFINQSLVGAVSLLRIVSIIFSSFFGLFGDIFTFFFIVAYITNIRIFGYPYMEMLANLDPKNVLLAIFRLPSRQKNQRPTMIFSKDSTSRGKK